MSKSHAMDSFRVGFVVSSLLLTSAAITASFLSSFPALSAHHKCLRNSIKKNRRSSRAVASAHRQTEIYSYGFVYDTVARSPSDSSSIYAVESHMSWARASI